MCGFLFPARFVIARPSPAASRLDERVMRRVQGIEQELQRVLGVLATVGGEQTTGYARAVFVPGSPRAILTELGQALLSYRDYHMLLLALAGTTTPPATRSAW